MIIDKFGTKRMCILPLVQTGEGGKHKQQLFLILMVKWFCGMTS
jgi:hypothetical protein